MSAASYFNTISWVVFGALSAVNLAVLAAYRTEWGARHLVPGARAALRWISRRRDLDWLDWEPVLAAGLIAFAGVSAYGLLSGAYGCHPPGVSDPVGLLSSGRAFLRGQNPFTVPDCGGRIQVPYGLVAVLLDALGSLGGLAGIYVVWGLVAFSVVPLVWALGGADRREVLLYVGTSVLLVPLISSQIDGATNALVPAVLLLSVYLARRSELLSAVAAGFLSTARFPNLFPLLGSTGAYRRRRVVAFLVAGLTFGAVTLLTYLVYREEFLGPVFLSQVGRRSFSLNLYGPLLFANALPSSLAVEGLQAGLTLALVLVVFLRVRSPLLGIAIVVTGFSLLTPFLSYNILIWLLPVALVAARARWWLWGIATVGSFNYDVALNVWAWDDGITWPSAVLDLVLTGLLLALFVELWRQARSDPGPAVAGTGSTPAPARGG